MPKVGTLSSKLKEHGYKVEENTKPLWEGPCSTGTMGGITQGLLSRYVVCAERFRLKTIEGWSPVDQFNHRMEYGQMWHTCEEAYASGINSPTGDWRIALERYCMDLAKQYRTQGSDVMHWMDVCKAQFPVYVEYWSKHPDMEKRSPLVQEHIFNVPYSLPSGRIVMLRGKWDSVDLIGKGKNARIWLQENKSKSEIIEHQLKRQLTFDLQTMVYLIALQAAQTSGISWGKNGEIAGVRYNVIRRPLSGGRHSIVQWKPTKKNPNGESRQEYYERLAGLIRGEPEYFFFRWNVEVSGGDIKKFKTEFLNPCLENLCDDYEWWNYCKMSDGRCSPFKYNERSAQFPFHRQRHFRLPFGIYNIIAEGGSSDYDEMLMTGSTAGLSREKDLFKELR